MTTGQIAYTIPGTYSFVCPIGITSVSVLCIGGGGQGGNSSALDSPGGGGGGLGYKNNIPNDSDFVFDVRCLANPFWDKSLRAQSGKDNNVKSFIKKDPASLEMITNIVKFLNKWIPKFLKSDRNYLTISIGCTGGQHRSVYITENVSKELRKKYTILVKHRDIK